MKGSEIKKIVLNKIQPYLTEQGYKKIESYAPSPAFIKKTDNHVSEIGFHFVSTTSVGFSRMQLSIHAVEDIIMEIGIPNHTFENFKSKDTEFLVTLKDTVTPIPNLLGIYVDIKNEAQALNYADWVLDYVKTNGSSFATQYSYLPNVLAEMNRLESEGKYWNEILGGLADYLFRGLIISKLCNDFDFEKKVQYCDEKLNSRPNLAVWLPYYEQLKERLKELQPLYNV